MTPEAAARHRSLLVAAFATIYLIWGSTYLAVAVAIRSIPPLLMASCRFLLAGMVLYTWGRIRSRERPRPAQWRWAFLLGGLFFLGGNGTVALVEMRLPSGITALAVATVSVWTALIEWIRPGGVRPRGPALVGILLGFLGVGVLVAPGRPGGGHVDGSLVLFLTASSFGWALAAILSRSASLPKSPPLAAGMEMLAGGALLVLASLGVGEWARFEPAAVSLPSLVALLYQVVFGSIVAFSAYFWLLRVSTPGKVATVGYVNPMVALFLGWAFAGEILTLRALVASLVIVVSVVLIVTTRDVGPASRPDAASATLSGAPPPEA